MPASPGTGGRLPVALLLQLTHPAQRGTVVPRDVGQWLALRQPTVQTRVQPLQNSVARRLVDVELAQAGAHRVQHLFFRGTWPGRIDSGAGCRLLRRRAGLCRSRPGYGFTGPVYSTAGAQLIGKR